MDLTGKKFWVALTGKPAVINPLWDLGRLRRFPSGSEPQRGAAVAAAGSGPQAGAVRGPRRGRAQAAWAAGVAPPLAPEPLAGRFSGFAKYKRFLRAQRKPLAVSQKMDLAAARGGLSPFGWKTAPRREKPENRPGAASPRIPLFARVITRAPARSRASCLDTFATSLGKIDRKIGVFWLCGAEKSTLLKTIQAGYKKMCVWYFLFLAYLTGNFRFFCVKILRFSMDKKKGTCYSCVANSQKNMPLYSGSNYRGR